MRINRKGFTLTEVLITCAIVGVLVTIGVPSFRKMIQRSRRIEAKVNLGGLYASEQGFYSYYQAYGNNLYMIGFSPDGQTGSRVYNVGFPSGSSCSGQGTFTPAQASTKGQGVFARNAQYYSTTSAPGDSTYSRSVTVASNGYSNICVSGLNAARGATPYNYILKDGFNASGVTGANSNVYSYTPPGSVFGESNGFFATADGVISSGNRQNAPAAERDIWFIDHERTLVNIHDGTN